jgi:hypothetical protein
MFEQKIFKFKLSVSIKEFVSVLREISKTSSTLFEFYKNIHSLNLNRNVSVSFLNGWKLSLGEIYDDIHTYIMLNINVSIFND